MLKNLLQVSWLVRAEIGLASRLGQVPSVSVHHFLLVEGSGNVEALPVWWKAGHLGLQAPQKLSSASVPQVGKSDDSDPKPWVPFSTLSTALPSVLHLFLPVTWEA